MIPCLLLLAIVIYWRKTSDKVLASFTIGPEDDWLIGFEKIPDVELPDHNFKGKIRSIGIGIFRIDFLTTIKEE